MALLVKKVKEVVVVEAATGTAGVSSQPRPQQAAGADDYFWAHLQKKKLRKTNAGDGDGCKVTREVTLFFNQEFDPLTTIQNQSNQAEADPEKKLKIDKDLEAQIGTTDRDWITNLEAIARLLDIFEWWEVTGRVKYPLIYVVACLVLPTPDSNGYLERVFSTGNWVDDQLRQKMKENTLKMKVLLQKTMEVLEESDRDTAREEYLASKLVAQKMVNNEELEGPVVVVEDSEDEAVGASDEEDDDLLPFEAGDYDSDSSVGSVESVTVVEC